jgi:hypothetical protein
LDRVAASVGILHGADIEFELVEDVPDGGVLLALPSLFLLGLLSKSPEILWTPEGFYPLKSTSYFWRCIVFDREGYSPQFFAR